jgi:hypothetical protein
LKTSSRPWFPPQCEKADIAAVKALASGSANPEQQVRAIKWIVEEACMYYNLSFCPGGEDGRRDSDFAEGRRFVGAEIVKMTKLDLTKLKSNSNEEAT